MYYVIVAIFGLIFGSFFLVVGTRLSENKSIIKPSSHCDSCKKELKWYELIPVLSYIILGGKCSKCHAKIPLMSIIIELLTALLFVLSYAIFGISYNFLISLVVSSLIIIILVSDFKYYIILDSPIITGSILLIIVSIISSSLVGTLYMVGEALIVFLIILLVKIVGDKVFKKESLGGGDIKLMLFVGLLLGFKFGLISFALASFIALPYALLLTIKKKEKEVPFGPFIIIAAFIVFIFQTEIGNILNTLFLLNI